MRILHYFFQKRGWAPISRGQYSIKRNPQVTRFWHVLTMARTTGASRKTTPYTVTTPNKSGFLSARLDYHMMWPTQFRLQAIVDGDVGIAAWLKDWAQNSRGFNPQRVTFFLLAACGPKGWANQNDSQGGATRILKPPQNRATFQVCW